MKYAWAKADISARRRRTSSSAASITTPRARVKAGKLVRVKAGRTYRLLLPGSPDVPEPPPKRIVTSHRADRKPPPLREIDIASLDYVPLPRAPLHWEEAIIIAVEEPPKIRNHSAFMAACQPL